jgi:23S rRNA (cytosine1962-C5)-methyltransferase
VHAAVKGASFTKSVDMSNTYTAWGEDNFRLNGLSLDQNEVVRADCLKFLDEEVASGTKYDLIVIDPPTISRSKKMDQMFDVQFDYIFLISRALDLLSPGGEIFFSTNSRKFTFDESQFPGAKIWEISEKTFPIDFHKKKIHRCWKIMQ